MKEAEGPAADTVADSPATREAQGLMQDKRSKQEIAAEAAKVKRAEKKVLKLAAKQAAADGGVAAAAPAVSTHTHTRARARLNVT